MKLLTELDSLDNVKDGETRKLITKATSSGSGNVVSSVSVSGDTVTYTKGVTALTAHQNAFSNVKVGSTTVAADSAGDTLELVAGSNITLTPDATNDKVTIAATNIYNKSEVDSLISAVSTMDIQVVQTLPTQDISTTTIYLVPKTASINDAYDEYIYVNNSWEHIGSTEVDLSNYYTKTQTDNLLDAKANASSLSTVATTGSYNDLSNKPTIPTKTSDLTNDSGFIDRLVILSYGNSTWNDFITAYQKNKVVYCRASSNSNPASGSQTRLAFMAYVNNATSPSNVEFQYYRSLSNPSVSSQPDEVYVYTLTNANKWTTTTRKASSTIAVGTGLSRSYTANTRTMTLSVDTSTMAQKSDLPTKTSDLTNDSGFITGYTETDPVFTASAASGITSSDITNWNNKSDFSGSYDDLTDKPTIPTVNNATLTIQKNGTTVNTFTANASSNVTANITVPTQTSELTNNSGYITSSALEDRPYYTSLYTVQDQSKPAGYYEVVSDFALDNSATDAYINSDAIKYKLNDNLEDIVDGKQDLITSTNKLDYSLLSNTPTIPTVPTNVSAFTNDSGYITGITSSDIYNVLGYYPAAEPHIYTYNSIRDITSTSDQTYIDLIDDIDNHRPIIIRVGMMSYVNVLGTYCDGTAILWFKNSDNSCTTITLINEGSSVDVQIDHINFAVKNADNKFSSSQSITGDLIVSGTAQIQDGLYCRPTGQADTPVGNSMLVIKRVTNSEAPNNGVVLEFGNSTSWAGQLFIGDNATQGIYYNGWSNGVRGSWIKLASQNDLAKNIITMHLATTQSFSNSYTRLNLSAKTTIGTKLSVSSNQVKIGAGVNHIKVSGTFGYNYKNAGLRYLRITKNFNTSNIDNTTIAMQLNYETATNHTGSLAITDIVIPVSEGDLIGMYVYGLNGDSARNTASSDMLQTHMTVEVVD